MSKLLVLYGSQTGCAQEVAERISRDAHRHHFITYTSSLDSYPLESYFEANTVIFVCSTTGQGNEPKNMKKFWKFLLRKSLPSDCLENQNYTIFGLGDSSYLKYNFVAKKLHRRLLQLGATNFFRNEFGDDQHYLGIDGTLDPWLSELWEFLMKRHPLPPGKDIIPETIRPPPKYKIEFDDSSMDSSSHDQLTTPQEYSQSQPFIATVKTNYRLTSMEHFQEVRHLEFDISNSGISYDPGDVVVFQPKNLPQRIVPVLKHLGFQNIADKKIKISKNSNLDLPTGWPTTLTVRELCEEYLDFFGSPRRYFFQLLSHFTTDQMEKEKLQEFASTEGQEDLYKYCHRVKRTFFEVIQEFRTTKIPLEYLCDLIPPIQPRYFSISSSLKAHPNEIHITAAIVKYKTKLSEMRTGVCTQWLASLQQNDSVKLWVEKGIMKLPADTSPIIMIGPGTGCAPFRSFIEERISQGIKDNYFFFGCRSKDMDFYYEDQMLNYVNSGFLELFVAFSRDQEHKVYVQHQIDKNSQLIWSLIERNATIYLSGNSKRMPIDVTEALKRVIQKEGSISEGDQFLDKLEKKNKWQLETWG